MCDLYVPHFHDMSNTKLPAEHRATAKIEVGSSSTRPCVAVCDVNRVIERDCACGVVLHLDADRSIARDFAPTEISEYQPGPETA